MENILFILSFLIFLILGIILFIKSLKYFKTLWKFKNKKKEGLEDDDFEYFD